MAYPEGKKVFTSDGDRSSVAREKWSSALRDALSGVDVVAAVEERAAAELDRRREESLEEMLEGLASLTFPTTPPTAKTATAPRRCRLRRKARE